MTHIAMAGLSAMQRYWLITGSVGPRPIGLITSCANNGLCNAAPFSAFNYMSEEPPLMVIAIDRYGDESHRPGEVKDTLKNIEGRGEFAVNMVDEAMIERAVRCGSDFPAHISEPEAVGFELTPCASIEIPRITEAPIVWECKLFKVLEFSAPRAIVFGEIVAMTFRDDLIDEVGLRVRVDRFAPIGRLGGPNYCRTNDRVRLPVPTYSTSGVPRV